MRPSSWLAALAAALVLTGLAGLSSIALRLELPPSAIGWLLVAGGGLGLATAEGAGFVLWVLGESTETRLNRARAWALELENQRKELSIQAAMPAATAPAIELVRPVPYNTVGDRGAERSLPIAARRSARWNQWQKLALGYLDWVAVKHGATSADLVGPALMFGDRGAWVDATNGLRDAGLVEKANGAPTALVGTLDQARARVLAGLVKWPDDRDPPAWRPTLVELVTESAPDAES